MALPIHHDTKPPPTAESFAPAVDSKPWTKEDDEVLRKLVVEFQKTDKFPPWGLIASRAKFGHNSGSCEKRWREIEHNKNMWTEGNRFWFKGKSEGGAFHAFGGQYNREMDASGAYIDMAKAVQAPM